MSVASETIGRQPLHPAFREMIERKRAEAMALQSWAPGCARCGECAPAVLPIDEARSWWAEHQAVCVALRAAA